MELAVTVKISVIFTTYNSPKWLEKVLWGFHYQSDKDFEVIIADDGSNADTRALIEQFASKTHLDIRHIWQEDNGFQKCKILNKAILEAKGDYLLMTDGDCIPRNDFVAVHRANAEPGYFLSGGYFKLPLGASELICEDDVASGRAFDKEWLVSKGVKPNMKCLKLTAGPLASKIYNSLTLTKRTWNGHNASCFKEDALRVNGFDERMRYGGLDVEFGFRLSNSGVKAKQIRYSAIVIHLDHNRDYINKTDYERNLEIRDDTLSNGTKTTPYGINKIAKHSDSLELKSESFGQNSIYTVTTTQREKKAMGN